MYRTSTSSQFWILVIISLCTWVIALETKSSFWKWAHCVLWADTLSICICDTFHSKQTYDTLLGVEWNISQSMVLVCLSLIQPPSDSYNLFVLGTYNNFTKASLHSFQYPFIMLCWYGHICIDLKASFVVTLSIILSSYDLVGVVISNSVKTCNIFYIYCIVLLYYVLSLPLPRRPWCRYFFLVKPLVWIPLLFLLRNPQ